MVKSFSIEEFRLDSVDIKLLKESVIEMDSVMPTAVVYSFLKDEVPHIKLVSQHVEIVVLLSFAYVIVGIIGTIEITIV